MVKQYRKKPFIIEAIQWTGNNLIAVQAFLLNENYDDCIEKINSCETPFEDFHEYEDDVANHGLCIESLEGIMKANIGDYIIKGVDGEFYPCKKDIFEKTYEEVKE